MAPGSNVTDVSKRNLCKCNVMINIKNIFQEHNI